MLFRILLGVYAAVNLTVFIMYGIDKAKAKGKKRRISERALMTAAVFGIVGGLLGMLTFHHKTKKPKFAVGLPLIFIAEAFVVSFLAAKGILSTP